MLREISSRRFDAHRHEKLQKRRILRLAHLAFTSIRIGHTELVGWSSNATFDLVVPLPFRERFSLVSEVSRSMTPIPRIRLHLRQWQYIGIRRWCEMTLAYEPTQDVCVVQAESVRVHRRCKASQSRRL